MDCVFHVTCEKCGHKFQFRINAEYTQDDVNRIAVCPKCEHSAYNGDSGKFIHFIDVANTLKDRVMFCKINRIEFTNYYRR